VLDGPRIKLDTRSPLIGSRTVGTWDAVSAPESRSKLEYGTLHKRLAPAGRIRTCGMRHIGPVGPALGATAAHAAKLHREPVHCCCY